MQRFFFLLLPLYFFLTAFQELPPTYFCYKGIDSDYSEKCLSKEELDMIDETLTTLVQRHKLSYDEILRLQAYLYTAQRDCAFVSYIIHGEFQGSLWPISTQILQLFFPSYHPPTPSQRDLYSAHITDLVFSRFCERFKQEASLPGVEEEFNNRKILLAQWTPWMALASDYCYLLPPPSGDIEWKKEKRALEKAQQNLTDEQIQVIDFWNKEGDWIQIANEYMLEKNSSLTQILLVRSQLAIALIDATIAYRQDKYIYKIERPTNSLISPPHSPSFPSGHATLASAACVILSHYFPEHRHTWEKLSKEAGLSRIWSGVHYPLDVSAGHALGRQIGRRTLSQNTCILNP